MIWVIVRTLQVQLMAMTFSVTLDISESPIKSMGFLEISNVTIIS